MSAVADRIFQDVVNSLPDQNGKVIAVTGCTSGTGYWLAHACIEKNATLLLLLNRASSRSQAAEDKLNAAKAELGSETEIVTIACDLMSFESTRNAASEVNAKVKSYGGLDVLANNAGIMAFPDTRTNDGFDVQMQTNHLSHFLLTKLCMESIEQAAESRGESRIVQHSSGARNMKFSIGDGKGELEAVFFERSEPQTLGGDDSQKCFMRYHMTKLANTVFAMALHDKLQAKGQSNIKSVVAEPGVAATELVVNLSDGHEDASIFSVPGVIKMFQPVYNFVGSFFMQSAADGACPIIEASLGEDVQSGDFFIPKNKRYGMPVKRIAGGVAVKEGREKLTLNKESQAMLWEKSEAAVGGSFLSSKL